MTSQHRGNARLLAERIPDTRLHMIPGARHAFFEERRDIASPLVLDFLSDSDTPAAPDVDST